MKYLMLAPILLLLGLDSIAQQQPSSRFSAELNFGVAVPVGSFASNTHNWLRIADESKASGWAQTGPAAQLSLNYRVHKHLGIILSISGQENYLSKSGVQNEERIILNINDNFEVATNPWKIIDIMAGLYYDIPLASGKWVFRPKFLAGVLKTALPAYSYSDPTNRMYSNGVFEIQMPLSFCYDLGGGLQWHFSKMAYLQLGLDFMHSVPKGYDYSLGAAPPHYTSKVPISTINTLLGIGIGF